MKCDDELLVEEIDKDPNEPASQVLLQHITECSRCRQRLEELAATAQWWKEASTVLPHDPEESYSSGSIIVAIDSSAARGDVGDTAALDMEVDVDEVPLGFLSAPSHPELLGRIGRYEVERLIGAGGMGIVLKGFDTELHRVVAIKVLAPHLSNSGAARRRFAREAQAAAAVVHENVIPIHNVETRDKLPYLVMQYVPGESVQTRVDQDGPLSVEETLRIGAQIADGLAAAHQQGLIHRDVKPANILLEQSVDRVLISDFGLARAVDDASLTRSGIVAGTPHYMSPEQARGAGIDCRSDMFGLGSVLYFMCTGHPPFRADGAMAVLHRICHDRQRPVFHVNHCVPLELSCLIDRLLEKEPDRRPATAEEVSGALATLLADWRTPGRQRLQTYARRRTKKRWQIGLLTTASVACVVVAIVLFPRNRLPHAFEASTQESELLPPEVESTKPPLVSAPIPPVFSGPAFDRELREIDASLRELEASWSAPMEPTVLPDHSYWTESIDELTEIIDEFETKELESDLPILKPLKGEHDAR